MASKEDPPNGVMEEKDSTSSDIAEQTAMEVDSEGAKPVDGGQGSAGSVPANERLLFCAEVLIGYKCEVQVSFCVLRSPLASAATVGWMAHNFQFSSPRRSSLARRLADPNSFIRAVGRWHCL
jgi:hypothetical protein